MIAVGEQAGRRQLFASGAYPAAPVSYRRFAPSVVRLPDGSTRLENRFTRATGRSPMILPGMTPTTVDAGIVAAAANGGFMAELAGGGQVNERIFDLRMEELGELLDPGQEVVFNTLFLDPYLWGMHLGRDRLVQGARRRGAPLCGVTVSAGIPEVDDAVALLDELASLGMWLNAFKPGTVDQIKKVVAIAKAAPDHKVYAHVEGGTAGGHHSWEDLDDLLLATYHDLRSVPNLIVCVGGGIGDPVRAGELLTGEWATRYGSIPLPVDGILLGTVAMACAEATASTSVKHALAAADGCVGFVESGSFDGGITSGRSGLNADIHFLDNSASRCAALLDSVAGDADAVDDRRDEIVAALAATAKPYFGDIAEMTYEQLLVRFVDLTAVGQGGRYEDGAWLDVTHRDRFIELLRRAEARLADADEGDVDSDFVERSSVDDPSGAVATLVAAHPSATSALLHPADVPYFLEVCRRPGKPVPFVPVIDADVRRWYQSDSLWQAQHPAYDADAVLVIPGPQAVTGITAADEPIADLLGEFEQSVTASLVLAGAVPAPVDRLRRRGQTKDLRGPAAILGETPTVVHGSRVRANPILAMAPVEDWLCTAESDGRLELAGLTIDGIGGATERVVLNADGDRAWAELEIPSLRSDHPDRLTIGFHHTHRSGVEVMEIDAHRWQTMLSGLLVDTLLGGVTTPVPLGEQVIVEVDIDPNRFSAHANLVGFVGGSGLPDGFLAVAWPAVFATLGASELVGGLLDLVHLEHHVELVDVSSVSSTAGMVGNSSRVRVSARVTALTEHHAGCRIDTEAVIADTATGDLVCRLESSFLIRDAVVPANSLPSVDEDHGAEVASRPRRTVARTKLRAPESMDAFAAISGDHNPIHRSVLIARLVGLGDPICHGAWTSATAQRVLLDGIDARAERLTSWSTKFLAPVLLGEDLTVTAARMGVRDGDTVYDVEVVADRPDGAVPVLMATAVVRAPRTAYLFPGQGIQREGMGMDGYARSAAAKAIWDRADAHTRDHLGFSILQIVRENPTEVTTPTEVYRHPAGVLHLTQFTQVAMASLASAQMAEMAEQGVKVTDAVCAGHSVGEYNALAAVSQVLPLEAVVELVYQRGLAMHHLVPRDGEGRSDYRLGVVRPHEVGMSHADAEQLIADLRDELGQPLEIVNFNLRGKQYAVAGTVSALERLESELADRTRPGSKPAFLLVPGIDVPFHSTVLRDGVAEFRHHLSAGLPDEVEPELLVGRYIPNLVPRSFTLDRDYIEEVAELTGSEPLAEILADWPARSANQGRLTRDLLVELLAWQFASPVRWIETQDLLFTPATAAAA